MDAAARVLLAGHDLAEGAMAALREQVFAYHAEGLGRFRASLYRQRGTIALVLRSIPFDIPTFAKLGVPAAITPMVEASRGLVVVAGGSGQGKTTTLAAMVGHLNASYPQHVITLEDPIEFLHEDQRGSVCQRGIGADTASFAAGLRAALRQDPDVIVVSDLADPEVVDAALHAVDTGHLVLASVAAPDVGRAVARLFALARRGLPDAPAASPPRSAACSPSASCPGATGRAPSWSANARRRPPPCATPCAGPARTSAPRCAICAI